MTTTERDRPFERQADLSDELAALVRRATDCTDLAAAAATTSTDANRIGGCRFTDIVTVSPSGELKARGSSDPATTHALIEREKVAEPATGEAVLKDPVRLPLDVPAVRAEFDVPLVVGGQSHGVIRFFAERGGHFDDEVRRICLLVAGSAAVAMHAVALHTTAGELKAALDSNRRIGMSMGILMSRYTVTETVAFDLLRATSQRLHRKVRDVAEDVILSGQLPPVPPARR